MAATALSKAAPTFPDDALPLAAVDTNVVDAALNTSAAKAPSNKSVAAGAGGAAKKAQAGRPKAGPKLKEKVSKACRQVWSHLPNVRFGSNRDNYAYKRVAGSFRVAKTELIEPANLMATAQPANLGRSPGIHPLRD
eukprot:jgi/Tetstr1/445011/TSEL_032819.t1